jgi:hypothetical protein
MSVIGLCFLAFAFGYGWGKVFKLLGLAASQWLN